MTTAFSVCVYCGSRPGASPAFTESARETGRLIGERGWRLVYGGGRAGLMGTVADAVLEAGGTAVGVIPRSLVDKEMAHRRLTELHIVETMHERKQMMAERADVFVALPGGIGTFEELFEVWTWRQLGYHDKPVGLLNAAGYYDGLLAFIRHTEQQGFVQPAQAALVQVEARPAALLDRLEALARTATAPDDYQRI
ncbi:TIGR00730 family Rossman fold protein [Caldimonas aquatica]|uniref:Cytokinin riboside 5'-monophosphate phosphoribohydrolase n=1 Tax=Caldimonas aquatica TaxID=376175 RepID=A0ABY6MN52_9BURK|nr:TIGR00730 family Rossman fold protein [Schlegelella aquatica]UZD53936.1 TIGR00730 family Rossman fold protein [Schlegelella aquatica]